MPRSKRKRPAPASSSPHEEVAVQRTGPQPLTVQKILKFGIHYSTAACLSRKGGAFKVLSFDTNTSVLKNAKEKPGPKIFFVYFSSSSGSNVTLHWLFSACRVRWLLAALRSAMH